MFAHEQPANSIEEARSKSRTQYCWYLSGENDYTNFRFDMIPPHWEHDHVYVWPSQWQQDGQVYLSPKHNPGATHYCTDQSVITTRCDVDIFVVDANNKNRELSFQTVYNKHNHAQQIRGMGNWASIIQKCCTKSTSEYVWVVSSEYDYTHFDFTWYPEPAQRTMFHIFGSQHQKWANVFRVHRQEFLNQCKWHNDIKQFPLLNFVDYQTVQTWSNNVEIVYVDFGNTGIFQQDLDHKTTRFFGTWLQTLGRICERTHSEHLWVTSSICDYTDFDFGWQPEPWQQDMLHVFASNEQAEGDTFLVPVQRFKAQQQRLELLGWFDTINYVEHITVPAHAWPTVDSIHYIDSQYAWLLRNGQQPVDYTPSFWKKPDLHVLNTSGSVSLCPRDCKTHFRTQAYDYPYILRHSRKELADNPLDVVYVSNGEKNADLNWNRLLELCPRAKRIDGVNGRAQAYKACAEASDTEWFLNVFAKCWVHDDFDFDWQPDYLQNNKHYIFDAHNPVTGLTYGHMGIIAYHKQLVLDCKTWGLDFTLSMPHGSVPVTASTADYATTPYETWRTAFREVVKLSQQQDPQSRYRANAWLTVGNGDLGEWSMRGAHDGVVFATSGTDLQLSFEWVWLKEHFQRLYNH